MRINAIILVSVLISVSCAGEDAGDETPRTCLPSQDLIIINSSEYMINHLYAHETVDYFNETIATKSEIATDMAIGESINIPVSYNDTYYFTFVRNIFTGSTNEIAVTTAYPVVIAECYAYTLHILEEEFSIDKSENYQTK